MRFFQKRWVAVLLCICMIAAALAIGQAKENTVTVEPAGVTAAEQLASEDYGAYTQYIRDDAGLLDASTVQWLSQTNALWDGRFGSICGVAAVEQIVGGSMEDAAFEMADEMGLGERDFMLLLDVSAEDWYFVYGEEASFYADEALEKLVTVQVDDIFRSPDECLTTMFLELENWYDTSFPVQGREIEAGETGMVVSGTVFFVLLILFLVFAAVVSALFRAGRRFAGGAGNWLPLIFLGSRHRTGHRFGPGPGPGPGPRPGGPMNRSGPGRPGGGFGRSDRGGFGRGGGFGGGSRGGRGGFGGRR